VEKFKYAGATVSLGQAAMLTVLNGVFKILASWLTGAVPTVYTVLYFTHHTVLTIPYSPYTVPYSPYRTHHPLYRTEVENHRTESAYREALVLKTFVLQASNYYGALLYAAFVKKHVVGCMPTQSSTTDASEQEAGQGVERGHGNCIAEMESLMLAIVLVRVLPSPTYG
jgi:hypothetical protein